MPTLLKLVFSRYFSLFILLLSFFFSCTTRKVYYGNVKLKQQPTQEIYLDGDKVINRRLSQKQQIENEKAFQKKISKAVAKELEKIKTDLNKSLDEKIARQIDQKLNANKLAEHIRNQHSRRSHSHPDFSTKLDNHLKNGHNHSHKSRAISKASIEKIINEKLDKRLSQPPEKRLTHSFNKNIEKELKKRIDQRLDKLLTQKADYAISESLHRQWHRQEKEEHTKDKDNTERNLKTKDKGTQEKKNSLITDKAETKTDSKPAQTYTVYFASGSWSLSRKAQATLAKIKIPDEAEVIVQGFTDNVGNFRYNRVLSKRRAKRVVDYLKTINKNARYRITALGELKPQANNFTARGRKRNRRVQIFIKLTDEK